METTSRPQPGWIYFILCPDLGVIKIGWSKGTVRKRVQACKTFCPAPVELVARLLGSKDDETRLHEMLADIHVHGEWFRDDPVIWDGLAMEMARRPAEVCGDFPAWMRAAERDRASMQRKLVARTALAAGSAKAQGFLF